MRTRLLHGSLFLDETEIFFPSGQRTEGSRLKLGVHGPAGAEANQLTPTDSLGQEGAGGLEV